MKFTRMEIPDVLLIEPDVHGDSRGYFVETFRQDKLEKFLGYSVDFIQDNESKSGKGVLRGMHYQLPPAAQSKLVRVITGAVLDVVLDIREGSPTFGQHVSVKLTESNKKQVFIPRGFAHGFLVLENDTVFSYKVDAYYAPESDRGIAFDDPALGIDWQLAREHLVFSEKDGCQPSLDGAELFSFAENYYG